MIEIDWFHISKRKRDHEQPIFLNNLIFLESLHTIGSLKSAALRDLKEQLLLPEFWTFHQYLEYVAH